MRIRELTYTVSENENGITVLGFLKRRGFSRRIINSIKQTGEITANGSRIRTADRLFCGDEVKIGIEEKQNGLFPNPDLKAPIIFSDNDIVIFDKPPFMPVHPSIAHYKDTLGNLFSALYPDYVFRPVNRLDKNTSGLCVCALNSYSAYNLSGRTEKCYFAIVNGNPPDEGVITLPIARESDSIIKRTVSPEGKPAETSYKSIFRRNGRTLLKLSLKTGRTHQIRVHLSAIGYPLCGDDMYGGSLKGINRQALHCGEVKFKHPVTGENILKRSEIPDDMKRLFSEETNED